MLAVAPRSTRLKEGPVNEYAITTDGATAPAPTAPSAPEDFSAVAARFNENVAAAALRLVDASQDFVSMIRSFTAAGEVLERSLSIHRELGVASQKALDDAREASIAAAAAAAEAHEAREGARSMLEKSEQQYGSVAELVENMQQRIAALAVLAAPLPYQAQAPAATSDSQPETQMESADAAAEGEADADTAAGEAQTPDASSNGWDGYEMRQAS